MVLLWQLKKNPGSNRIRGNDTNWDPFRHMWREWYLKIYSKILNSHLRVSNFFSTIQTWFSVLARQDELTHGNYSTYPHVWHTLVCQKFITEDIGVCKGYWILWAPINLECMRTGSLVILKRTSLK